MSVTHGRSRSVDRPSAGAPSAGVAAALDALCDAQPFHTGWYFKDLHTGQEADRHGDVVVPSASTRKTDLLVAALRAVSQGALSLERPVTITAEHQRTTSGCFQYLRPGFTITLRDALVMMIIVSDNACAGIVGDLVGLDAVNALCRAAGMTGTTHRDLHPRGVGRADAAAAPRGRSINETTPRDSGRLLELVVRGTEDPAAAARLGCTPELCALALDILSWQKQGKLPFLLPSGTRVAHKPGANASCLTDAGVLYAAAAGTRTGALDESVSSSTPTRPRLVLTVFTRGIPRTLPDGTPGTAAAALLVARLARTCWDAVVHR